MKTTITLAALLFSLTSFGQIKSYGFKMKDSIVVGSNSTLFAGIGNNYQVVVTDGFKKVAYLKEDSSIVVIDSLATIKQLFAQIKYLQKQSDILFAAKNVLNCVNTRGYVMNVNLDKFNKATSEYFKATKRKEKYDKMQLMHILIMDKKGTIKGFVNQ